ADGVGTVGGVAVADIAVIQGDGAIGSAPDGQLAVPALAFGAQSGQQHQRGPWLQRGHLFVCDASPTDDDPRWVTVGNHGKTVRTVWSASHPRSNRSTDRRRWVWGAALYPPGFSLSTSAMSTVHRVPAKPAFQSVDAHLQELARRS